jgi:hypothetical protein
LIDIGALDDVTDLLKSLVENLEVARTDAKRLPECAHALEGARIGSAVNRRSPGDPALLDVITLCRNLQFLVGDPLAPLAEQIEDRIGNQVVKWHSTRDDDFFGTSIYYMPFMKSDVDRSVLYEPDPEVQQADAEYYGKLKLSRATGWNRVAFLPLRASLTRRRPMAISPKGGGTGPKKGTRKKKKRAGKKR